MTMGASQATEDSFAPMSISQIFDRTFRLYRNNFLRFITVISVISLPTAVLMLIPLARLNEIQERLSAMGTNPAQTGSMDDLFALMQQFGVIMVIVFGVGIFSWTLSSGALAKSISEAYLGHDVSVVEVYRFVFGRFWSLLGAGVLITLVSTIGYMLCVVPGVFLQLWFSLATPAIVIEELGSVRGMGRSKELAKDNLGKIFAVSLLMLLLSSVISLPLNQLGAYIGKSFTRSDMSMVGAIVQQLLSLPGQLIAAPILSTAIVLLYYDLRIRKEGFDLEMLASSMASRQNRKP